jgi:hypothetical protein
MIAERKGKHLSTLKYQFMYSMWDFHWQSIFFFQLGNVFQIPRKIILLRNFLRKRFYHHPNHLNLNLILKVLLKHLCFSHPVSLYHMELNLFQMSQFQIQFPKKRIPSECLLLPVLTVSTTALWVTTMHPGNSCRSIFNWLELSGQTYSFVAECSLWYRSCSPILSFSSFENGRL